MVMIINYNKLCASLWENLMSEFYVNLAKVKFLRLYSIVHVAMESTKMANFTCQSKSFISKFFTCQVSACELQSFSCLDLAMAYTHKLPKLCSATLITCTFFLVLLLMVNVGKFSFKYMMRCYFPFILLLHVKNTILFNPFK